jgi:hypothetical protein
MGRGRNGSEMRGYCELLVILMMMTTTKEEKKQQREVFPLSAQKPHIYVRTIFVR